MARTLRTVTLGCKVNQYETELLREGLLRLGYRNAEPGEPAQLCVVNTCTVTAEGDLKSRKAIRQLHRENPQTEIIVMGCYATRDPQAVAALPGVVDVVTDKRQLPELLARLGLAEREKGDSPHLCEAPGGRAPTEGWSRQMGTVPFFLPRGISQFGREHRAYVKVQDGCRMKCAFCIIPSVRPNLSSRPVADVLAEARQLVANGYRELVLTGIHLGHYGREKGDSLPRCEALPSAVGNALRGVPGAGKDVVPASPAERHRGRSLQQYDALGNLFPAACLSPASPHPDPLPEGEGGKNRLANLVRRLAALEGEFRLRLSSLEAAEVSPELVDLLAEYPEKICPHLHVSLQSGSDSVLARMGRRGDSRQMLQRCRSIREKLDMPALTTDIIVGFPGETEAEFQETCRVVEEIGFSKVHVFRFSPREGTPAARMPDQVPPPVKQQRAKVLIELAGQLRQEYLRQLRGRRVQVLVEAPAQRIRGQSPFVRSTLRAGTNRRLVAANGDCPLFRGELLTGIGDRYMTVELAGPAAWVGRLMWVVAGSPVEGRQVALATVRAFC